MTSMTVVMNERSKRELYEQFEYQQYDSEVTRVHDLDELLRQLQIQRSSRRTWSTTTDAGANEF